MTLRFGVVGPGFIGRVHAQAIQAAEGAELVAAVGTHAARLAAFCDELGARPCGSLDELLADDGVDVVVIATPNDLHVPQALACLEAGRHVLLEKPMACDRAAAESLVARARALDRRVLIGHLWRFDREAQRLRAAVAEGAIGRVVKTKGYGVHVNWGPSGWFVESARAGGGALIDMGVHAIDTVRYLLGDPRAEAVYARLGTHYGGYDVDDSGILLITWANGVESLIECGWRHPHADGVEASTQLFGTAGYGRLFPTELQLSVDGKAVPVPLALPKRRRHMELEIFQRQIAELVAAIEEGRDPIPGAEHGLEVMRICDAAYLSAREDRRVELGGEP